MIVESYWDGRRYRLECSESNSEFDMRLFAHCFPSLIGWTCKGKHLNDSPTNRRYLEQMFRAHGVEEIKYEQKERSRE